MQFFPWTIDQIDTELVVELSDIELMVLKYFNKEDLHKNKKIKNHAYYLEIIFRIIYSYFLYKLIFFFCLQI